MIQGRYIHARLSAQSALFSRAAASNMIPFGHGDLD